MVKIYLDTNRLIDFYQSASDKIDVFDDLLQHKKSLVLTEQTINEFRRNRVSTLNWLAVQFKKSIDVNPPYTTSILRAMPEHKELAELLDAYKTKGKTILNHLREFIADESKDPVAQKFFALHRDTAVPKLPITADAINKARERKLLGNPPCSPDKHTIGDEVIWEILLANLTDDLIVVTKDSTFHENLSLLAEEFRTRTKHRLLLVTESYSDALQKIGEVPSDALIEAEKRLAEAATLFENMSERDRSAPYAPADPSHWAGVPPTNVGDANRRILAALSTIVGDKKRKDMDQLASVLQDYVDSLRKIWAAANETKARNGVADNLI